MTAEEIARNLVAELDHLNHPKVWHKEVTEARIALAKIYLHRALTRELSTSPHGVVVTYQG